MPERIRAKSLGRRRTTTPGRFFRRLDATIVCLMDLHTSSWVARYMIHAYTKLTRGGAARRRSAERNKDDTVPSVLSRSRHFKKLYFYFNITAYSDDGFVQARALFGEVCCRLA